MTDKVEIIDPCSDPRWDTFVTNHPLGWIVHLSGWKTLLEKSFPHTNGHYLTIIDSQQNELKAALPLFEVRSWLTGNRLVSIPFATLCDPLIATNHELNILLEEALNLSKELKMSYMEIRTLNSSLLKNDNRMGSSSVYKHHYIPLDKDSESLKKSFHRTNVRQRIQRALNSNVRVRVADSESDLERFYTLYKKTRKKHGLPSQPYIFFQVLWDIFNESKQMMLLLAEFNDKPVAGLLLLKFKHRVSAEILGTDEAYLNVSPNHLLFWEAIKSASMDGFKIFDFGRTASDNESLMHFKNHWGTTVVDLPQYYFPAIKAEKFSYHKIPSKNIISKLCHNLPDLLYQEMSDFCYKHLG